MTWDCKNTLLANVKLWPGSTSIHKYYPDSSIYFVAQTYKLLTCLQVSFRSPFRWHQSRFAMSWMSITSCLIHISWYSVIFQTQPTGSCWTNPSHWRCSKTLFLSSRPSSSTDSRSSITARLCFELMMNSQSALAYPHLRYIFTHVYMYIKVYKHVHRFHFAFVF